VLVATAIADHDPPVAFDLQGNRRVLDPERPPATPVIAWSRWKPIFRRRQRPSGAIVRLLSVASAASPVPPAAPGLYMTKAISWTILRAG